jgi:hypothetical protein
MPAYDPAVAETTASQMQAAARTLLELHVLNASKASLDCDGTALDPAEFTEPPHKSGVTGIGFHTQAYFAMVTMVIAVPTGVKVFSWIATMWSGSLELRTPMLWAIGFIVVFTVGGVTEVAWSLFGQAPMGWGRVQAAEGRALERAYKALRLQSICPFDGEEPFAAIIRCTAEPAKVDKRTRSKWSRVLRYALRYKSHSEPLDQFIKRKGGINECAERFLCASSQVRSSRLLRPRADKVKKLSKESQGEIL